MEAPGPHLLADLQGSFAQRLRLLVLPSLAVEHREVVQSGRHLQRGWREVSRSMLRAPRASESVRSRRRFPDRDAQSTPVPQSHQSAAAGPDCLKSHGTGLCTSGSGL